MAQPFGNIGIPQQKAFSQREVGVFRNTGPLVLDGHFHDRGHGTHPGGVAGGLVGVPYPRHGSPGSRLLGIRTSRGVIHVPN